MVRDYFKKHYSYEELESYLVHKRNLQRMEIASIKKHIDNCRNCWNIWNKVRWDKAINTDGLNELRSYLKEDFILYFDSSWALANEWYRKTPQSSEEIIDFYKQTRGYLYNSLIFFESGDRKDFTSYYRDFQVDYSISTVIDYGCGIGNDGLVMLEKNLKIYFADFESPSINFLRWRLRNRGYTDRELNQLIVNIEKDDFPEADMIWTVDTLEHMVEPLKIFNAISNNTRLFVYFIDEDDQAGGRHPFHMPFKYSDINNELLKQGFKKVKHPVLSVWQRE